MTTAKGSYQTVTQATEAAESERLRAQLAALFAHEVQGLKSVGFPSAAPRILEVGCGNGAVLPAVKRAFGAGWAAGIDLDARLLSNARAQVPVARADGARLPFADRSFDAVFFRYVLRHVPGPERLLQEAKRVLKQGGHLLALDADDGGLLFDPVPPRWPELSHALEQSVRRRGANPMIGRALHRLLVEAGLEQVCTTAQVLTNSQVPAPAFIELFLAPNARPVDADLLAPEAAQAAWGALRAWALRRDSFCCGLGVFAGGVRP